ncbi:MAG: SLC13 family permease [bacterium]|nr:MAG: SLC13 family permease [bacterium]
MIEIFIILTLVVFVILLIRNSSRTYILFGGLLLIYYLFGLIDTKTMLVNFVNTSLIKLVLLMIVSLVVQRTVMINGLSDLLIKKSLKRSVFNLTAVVSLMSAFLNNTAAVAAMIAPVKKNRFHPPSKLLIPLSYSAIFGGTMTLIGTSTNLIVNGFVRSAGLKPIGLFDFAYVGIPLSIAGILLLIIFSDKLLAKRDGSALSYLVEASVLSGSKLIGNSIEKNGLKNLNGISVEAVMRNGKRRDMPGNNETIKAGDIIIFSCNKDNLASFSFIDGITIFGKKNRYLSNSAIVEVVVSRFSDLIGKTIENVDFETTFDASMVAFKRGTETISGTIGKIKIKKGDSFLISADTEFSKRQNLRKNFYIISDMNNNKILSRKKSYIALFLFFAAIISAALNLIPLIKGLLIVLTVFILLKFITFEEIKRNIPLELIIIIGSALGISDVMVNFGVAQMAARFMQPVFSEWGVMGGFVGVYLFTLLLTELITNNAAAALAFPIALQTANLYGANPYPFIFAVIYAASGSFIFPHGYQTNLMVASAGGYKISDFIKIGIPVSIVYSIIVIFLVPFFFPFK